MLSWKNDNPSLFNDFLWFDYTFFHGGEFVIHTTVIIWQNDMFLAGYQVTSLWNVLKMYR